MRQFYFALIFAILSLNSFSQTLPNINDIYPKWHIEDNTDLEIEFDVPYNMVTYEYSIESCFVEDEYYSIGISDEGNLTDETHTIQIDLESVYPEEADPTLMGECTYFIILELFSEDQSSTRMAIFYVSPYSLINNEMFDCDYQFHPWTLDTIPYNTSLFLPSNASNNLYAVQLIMDFGMIEDSEGQITTITLTNPAGNEVVVDFENDTFDGTSLTSRLYSDNVDFDSPNPNYGAFSSYEPLNAFIDEQLNGEWIVSVSNTGGSNTRLFGGCLNFNTLDVDIEDCINHAAGHMYYDINNDGIKNENEPGFSGVLQVSLEDTYGQLSLQDNGNFEMCTSDDFITVYPPNPPEYYEFVPESYELDFNEEESFEDINFALQAIVELDDLEIDLYHTFPDRPGFDNTYYVSYQNIGTTCIDDASVVINLAPALTIDGVEGVEYSIDGNTITADLGSLCYPESGSFVIHHALSEDTPIGTILENTATIHPLETDYAPTNNIDNHGSTVVGSYDPNDKLVTPEEFHPSFLDTDQPLEYMIRFQNTGNFYAENVVIVDTMDSKLDLGSFELVSVSHNVEIEFEGNEVSFIFNDIFLPDSTTNEPESHGYVRYRIRPKDDMSIGESIDNTAYIYFDFNDPIITNTTTTPLTEVVGVYEIDQVELTAFPNPAENEITVMWPQGLPMDGLVVLDLAGKEVISLSLDNQNNQVTIPVGSLSSGIYIIESIGKTQAKPIKMIKH